jgi:hypothetical protein
MLSTIMQMGNQQESPPLQRKLGADSFDSNKVGVEPMRRYANDARGLKVGGAVLERPKPLEERKGQYSSPPK